MARLPLVLAVSALSSAAVAADLPARSDPPLAPISQPYNWTGFYAGLTAGYADPTAKIGIVPGGDWVNDPDIVGVTAAATRSLKLQGFIGGAQAGYNYQTGNLVFGVVGDISGLNVGKSYASPVFPGAVSGTYSANGAVNLNYLATLRGRAGFAVDNLLFYVTGGVAFTGEKFRQSINYQNVTRVPALPLTGPLGGANAGSVSKTSVSWTLGAGVEYAFSKQWTANAEYLYADLKSLSFNSVYGPNGFTPGTYKIQHKASLSGLNVFRIGVNYRFGT